MRHDWPQEMLLRDGWQKCSSHSMICTKTAGLADKLRWPEYQQHVSKLLFQWMEFQRNRELYEPFAVKQPLPCEESIPNLDCREACAQKCRHVEATPLQLTWMPPSSRTAINQWGATLQDYNFIFSFWTKTTTDPDENLQCLSTWTQHLLFSYIWEVMEHRSLLDAPTSPWRSLNLRCCHTIFSKISQDLRN